MLNSSGNLRGFVQSISVVNTLILETCTFAKKRQVDSLTVLCQIDALLGGQYQTTECKQTLALP